MPWSSGPAKSSGKIVIRSKRIGSQSNEWCSRLSCGPPDTRQPARHLQAILFVLRAEFRLEPRLFYGQHEQNHADGECCNQLQERDRMKNRRLSEHHKGNTPIHWIPDNPIRPYYYELLRW